MTTETPTEALRPPSELATNAQEIGVVPSELTDFSGLPGPLFLVVRGPPGSGKTSLAMSLLLGFEGSRVFLTARTTRASLVRDFPWVAGLDRDVPDIVELDSAPEEIVDSNLARAPPRYRRLESREARAQVEHLWLPGAVQALRREGRAERSMVVFDSWDAFLEGYIGRHGVDPGTPNRTELERVLLRFLQSAGLHAVFVLERGEATPLDYLVDGIVTLTRDSSEDRVERWLRIEKLRGTAIEQPSYPFTLSRAQFRAFAPVPPAIEFVPPMPDVDPAPERESLWPGSAGLAKVFGRLPLGRMSLLEVEPGTAEFFTRLLYAPLALTVLSGGGNVLEFAPETVLPREIWSFYRSAFSDDLLRDHLRLIYSPPVARELPTEAYAPAPEANVLLATPALTPRSPEILTFLRASAPNSGPNLSIISVEAVRAYAESESGSRITPRVLVPWVKTYLQDAPCHALLLGNPADPLFASARGSAVTHIRLREIRGRVFVYGIRPKTETFVLDFLRSPRAGERTLLFDLVPVI